MDKLKGMAEKVTHKGGNKEGGGSSANAGKEDYVDKGLDSAEKKFGMQQSRETNEMMTDKGRDFVEKQTGKDIPDKVSN